MSKNFEEEYKAMTENDLPDLWSRIDAGLTSKATATEPMVEKTSEDKKGIIILIKRYKTVVAAAVCVIAIIPAVMMMGNAGLDGSKSSSDMAMENSTITEIAAAGEMIADDEAADCAAEDTVEKSATEEIQEKKEIRKTIRNHM